MNDQEKFWKGEFGDAYVQRNRVPWQNRQAFWELMLEHTAARSILEVGCNAGWNLMALRAIDPTIKLRGVDVNAAALAEAKANYLDAREVPAIKVGKNWPKHFDLVFTAGVLIHVGTKELEPTMASIVEASSRWVLAVEYAAASEEEVPYRGHTEKLWRRAYGPMYEEMGLDMVEVGDLAPGDGFDNCRFWLMRKT